MEDRVVNTGVFRFGDYELDTARRLLTRSGEPLELNAKAFDLLSMLVACHGEVVSKDRLLESVWPGQFVEENNLTVQISALRKVFSADQAASRFISTIPGKGYCFVAEVTSDEIEDEIIVESRSVEHITFEQTTESAEPLQLAPARATLWTIFAGVGILVLAVGGFAGWKYLSAGRSVKTDSIAVLPFINETSDANNEYLSDGLAESVMYSLSSVPGIRVMSRTSAFRYKGKDVDAKTIGRELNVRSILSGRVRKVGDSLNISAELVSADDNSVLWGEQFTRKLSDLEKLQSDIAGSISSQLRFKLTGSAPRMTENAEAYRIYLQARYYWNKRTPENIKKSIELFKSAIALDPQFTQAYGGLAMAYEVQVANGVFTDDEIRQIDNLTSETAKKALEMDPDLAEAHAVLGMRRMQQWDFAGSEESLKRAIEINPNFATAYQWYSELLAALGRLDEAKVNIDKAYELDPFSPAIIMNIGLRYLSAGHVDEAIAQFRKLNEMEPGYPMAYIYLGEAYEEKGMLLEALEPYCKSEELLHIGTPERCEKYNGDIRAAFQKDGPAGYWRKSLEVAKEYRKDGVMDDVSMAGAYLRAGERDNAFALLEQAYAAHSSFIVYLRVDLPFRHFKDDPRYQDLLKRIGLPPL